MKKTKIVQVGFEMTRRCNMRCRFCSRGEAQDIDITKEIIDKALDELKNFDIGYLRLHGGEPLLNPDMIEYIVDRIIQRNIPVYQGIIFSNGTVFNASIKAAIEKLGNYCARNSSNKSIKKYIDTFARIYEDVSAPCSVIVSDMEHEQIDFDKFSSFYNQSHVKCYQQSKHYSGKNDIIIAGRSADNLQYYISNGYTNLSPQQDTNKYCIIEDCDMDNITINKGISISANGNVYVGCNQEYDALDKENICNILHCKNDLYNKIDEWCWKYPLNSHTQTKRNNIRSMMFRYENGIDNHDWLDGASMNESAYKFLKQVSTFYPMLEKYIRRYHEVYPKMSHFQLQSLVQYEFAKGVPIQYRDKIMPLLSFFENSDDNNFSDKECNEVINRIKTLIN